MIRLGILLSVLSTAGLLATGATQAAHSKTKTLFGTVGPGFTITLKNGAGTKVKTVAAGTYNFVIADKSKIHNFHLIGSGLDRKTGVSFMGTLTWKLIKVKAGTTYKYRCDPHRTIMHGSFKGKQGGSSIHNDL